MRKAWLGGLLVLALVALVAAACDDQDDDGPGAGSPAATQTEEPAAVSQEATPTADQQAPTPDRGEEDRGEGERPTSTEDGSLSVAEIADRAGRSVVRVETGFGTGSGWVLDDQGHIVTNNHVVVVSTFAGEEVAPEIVVFTNDGRELPAEVVGRDPRSDLAVLRVEATDLEPLPLGDLDEARIGDPVVAIGYALNLGESPSVTTGVISAKERRIIQDTPILGALQTDAAINPGNSGGPLLNLRGEVLGVNTAIIPAAQGIGFAVSVETVRAVAREILENGSVARGYLGIGDFEDITEEMAERLDLAVESGVRVNRVEPGSPADLGGLRPGDIITSVAGEDVRVSSDITVALIGHPPGETIEVQIFRDGERVTLEIALGEIPF